MRQICLFLREALEKIPSNIRYIAGKLFQPQITAHSQVYINFPLRGAILS